MFQAVNIPCQHKDLIHDVAYDHHGHRLATASSDQTVKIWDFDINANTWICTATWKSHFGSVWKVTWAHPEFGQVIATCSFDRTAAIWEEIVGSEACPGIIFPLQFVTVVKSLLRSERRLQESLGKKSQPRRFPNIRH